MKYLLPFLLLSFPSFIFAESNSKKDLFKLRLQYNPETLNPFDSQYNNSTKEILSYIHETLLCNLPDSEKWRSCLAKSWSYDPEKQVAKFNLRTEAVFSDGKPVTAEDVVFSYNAILDERYHATVLAQDYKQIKKVVLIDKFNVEFYFENPTFQSLDSVFGKLPILPKHIYSKVLEGEKFTSKAIGSGPYILKKFRRGGSIILEQNPKWWGRDDETFKKTNLFPRIQYKVVSENSVAYLMFKKGELDYLNLTSGQYLTEIEEKNLKFKIFKKQRMGSNGVTLLVWNLQDQLLKEKYIRTALDHLIPRPLILEKLSKGIRPLISGPVYSGSVFESTVYKPTEFSPETALKTLQENGWSDKNKDGILDKEIEGKSVNLTVEVLDSIQGSSAAYLTLFQEEARKIGVEIKIKTLDWNALNKLLDERNYQSVNLNMSQGSNDWDPYGTYHSDSMANKGNNFFNYKNPKVDQLILEARAEFDFEKRVSILKKVVDLLIEDRVHSYIMSEKYLLYAVNSRIKMPVEDSTLSGTRMIYWSF